MTQLQKDLSILIPEINKTISNISFPVVKELKEVLWDIIDKSMIEYKISTYEELEDALITYISIKYNKDNMLFGFLK
jgi:hypothetical protein